MSHAREIQAVTDALRNAERYPDYWAEVGQCDGLDGCQDCLELVARDVLRAVEQCGKAQSKPHAAHGPQG
jgi:hypothetical protein